MSEPTISFAGDGSLPSGTPQIQFLEIPGRVFTTKRFNVTAPGNVTANTNAIGNFNGLRMTLGGRTGEMDLDIRSFSETLPARGCTFVASSANKVRGWIVTQVGEPREKEGEIMVSVSFHELANPLIMVPVGDYTFVTGTAITPVVFAAAARHTVASAGWAIETQSIDMWRPLQEDQAVTTCDTELQTGLTIASGQLSGTPTATGVKKIRIRATDTANPQLVGWRDIQITVNAPG
jgi:hypothetical protein